MKYKLILAAASLSLLQHLTVNAYSEAHTRPAFTVAATLDLSGRWSWFNESVRNGLSLAEEQINGLEGISGLPVRLIVSDNQGNPGNAAASIRKLINENHIDLVYSTSDRIVEQVVPDTSKAGILLIDSSPPLEAAKLQKLVLRDHIDIGDHVRLLVRAAKHFKFSRVTYIKEDGRICAFHQEIFLKEAAKQKLTILEKLELPEVERDFRVMLRKAARQFPQALVLCAPRNAAVIMEQLAALKLLHIPTLHTTAPLMPQANSARLMSFFSKNRAVSTWYGFAKGSLSEVQLNFIKAYQKRFSSYPSPEASYAYDIFYAAAAAFASCSKAKQISTCAAAELQKTRLLGAGGLLSFDELGNSERESFLIAAADDDWQTLDLDGRPK